MSRGFGLIERRIIDLLEPSGEHDDMAAPDRVLSVGDICDAAFCLKGNPASRVQRLSATRAAYRLLAQTAAAMETHLAEIRRVIAETEAALGRPPGRREHLWFIGGDTVGIDRKFAEAMQAALRGGAPYRRFAKLQDWRETQTVDRRLWFHPKDHPVRVWAVSIQPAGVIWADTEIVRITERNVMVRYADATARLDREDLSRWWANWRGVMFVSSRTGRIAARLDELWQRRYGASTAGAPPVLRMPLAAAMALLGVSGDYTKDDVIAAFRREVKKAHPDAGGTAEQFHKLVAARDRLLAALGTSAPAPKMPTYDALGRDDPLSTGAARLADWP